MSEVSTCNGTEDDCSLAHGNGLPDARDISTFETSTRSPSNVTECGEAREHGDRPELAWHRQTW